METESAIIQMFHGVRGQIESVSLSKKCHELFKQCCESEQKLREKLSPELLPLFEKIMGDIHDMYCEEIDNYYAEGFRLGCLIGMEVVKTPEV